MSIKKLILILFAIIALFLSFLLYQHPIVLKAATESTKVLSPPINATVKINGVFQPTAKCFEMKFDYNGNHNDRLFLWLKDTSVNYNVIVDRLRKDVGTPNSDGNMYSDLLLNKYLFLTEDSFSAVSVKSEKSFAQDPKLEVNEKYIRFTIPRWSKYDEQIIEIVFDNTSV